MKAGPLPYRHPSLPTAERVRDLLERMTLEEKLAQLSSAWLSEVSDEAGFSAGKAKARIGYGTGQITRPAGSGAMLPAETAQANNAVQAFLTRETRLGIPAIVHEECLSGLMARRAALFPQIIGLASAWDPELVEAVAAVIRAQARAVGAHQGLAPVLDVARDARWGRVEETYGEDPYLVACLGSAYVRGLQGQDLQEGVAATGKHFAAHGLSEGGLNWAPVHVGPREFREVLLFPFEAAVREAGLAGIMNAYHELDGVPVTASAELLTGILRDEWGFDGLVVSDYNAVVMLADYHRVAGSKGEAAALALEAGLDLELPAADCYAAPLLEAIQAGKVAQAVVERAVSRVLALKFRLGLFENPFVDPGQAAEAYARPEQVELARRAARESLVLLKNEGGLLPLRPDLGSLAVIGPNADSLRRMVGDYAYGSFAELMEGGDQPPETTRFPERFPPGMITILEAIRRRVSPGTRVRYAQGCGFNDPSRNGFAEAVELARASDAVVLVLGGKSGLTADCTSGELRDRATLGLPGAQEELALAVLAAGKPAVLVLVDGRPEAIPTLAERLPALLQAWLPGQEGGPAVAEALFGDVNPGGKLPISFPRSAGQMPVYYRRKPSGGQSFNFVDYVDERVKPLFPFGHGLSYTRFEYGDLQIEPAQAAPAGQVTVRLTVKNAGDRPGDEVVQLYLRDELASLTRPVKELKGFRRLALGPGESRTVVFTLPAAQLAFYDREMRYVVEPGQFTVQVGSSSEDIRLAGSFEIVGETTPVTRKVFFSNSSIE
jgi:beta-glucosidase